MDASDYGSTEMQMLAWSIALGLAQLLLATLLSVLQRGLPWGVGPRDEPSPPLGTMAARIERAFKNYLETFVFFLGVVLMAQVLSKQTDIGALGTQIYFWSRLAYVPAYALGVPFLRTLLWVASLAGVVMVLASVWPGM